MHDKNYEFYCGARDQAWKTLIECGITSLPVDLKLIADHYGITIALYSDNPITALFPSHDDDGFITRINDVRYIFLNDRIKTRARRRFTLGHELGHGIMGHPLDVIVMRNTETDSITDPLEMQDNVFSRDIIAPACVLHGLGVTTSDEIMRICGLSRKSAEIRMERMRLLNHRNAYGRSSLERQVMDMFAGFVRDNRKK